ncbi:MAG: phage portal protein [Nitrososphaeraceae archaeon]|nr:phage portal protein [Nitrososphaeraceae archaeon]
MNFLQRLNNAVEFKGTQPSGVLTTDEPVIVGNDVVFYPGDSGERFVKYGYTMNDAVYSIVSKNSDKASQIPFYLAEVKDTEKKTYEEYKALMKYFKGQPKIAKELQIMKKAMIESYDYKTPLSKLLQKPNRNQTWSQFLELLFLLRELQGEGNIWFNRGLGTKTLEMFSIPKPHLNLVGNGKDPYEIVAYQFNLNGATITWPKDQVLMWKYSNPDNLSTTLSHLRGLAPLQSALNLLQALNEGDKRMVKSNYNAGAYGALYWKTPRDLSTGQKEELRTKVDNAVSSSDMAGKLAILTGEWGYHNFGLSVADQKLLEQYGYGFTRLCRVFNTPSYIFDEGGATWDKARQAYRQWIYSKISPAIYELRGMLSDKLIPEFGMNPETTMIDCDIMSLPEMSEDLKELVDSVKAADWLSKNEKRMATGYEPLGPEYDKVESDDIGGNLDNEMNLLNEGR